MIWQLQKDCRNELVADAIRRDEVDAVLKCLHFRDNTKLDDDGYFKVIFLLYYAFFYCTSTVCTSFFLQLLYRYYYISSATYYKTLHNVAGAPHL